MAAIHQRLRSCTSRTAASRFASTVRVDQAERLVDEPAADALLEAARQGAGDLGVAARRERRRARPGAGAGDEPRRRVVARQLAEEADETAGEAEGVAGLGQPVGGVAAELHPAQPVLERGGVEEVRLEEAADVAGGAGLVRRQERGVRDRQAERAAEQRLDREPVGEAADHAGLGHRLHEPGPARLGAEEVGGEEDRDEGEQRAGREAAGAREGVEVSHRPRR